MPGFEDESAEDSRPTKLHLPGLTVLWASEVGRTKRLVRTTDVDSPEPRTDFHRYPPSWHMSDAGAMDDVHSPAQRGFRGRELRTVSRSPVPKDSRTLPLSASKLITTVAPSANASESTLVIVVDDDASVANSTCRLIRSLGMRAEAFFSGADLLNSGRASEASCLILDVRMPNLDGLQLQRRLKEIRPSISVIFFSAHAGKEEEDEALRYGAVAFLRKPVHRDDLLRVIRMALERRS